MSEVWRGGRPGIEGFSLPKKRNLEWSLFLQTNKRPKSSQRENFSCCLNARLMVCKNVSELKSQ